MFDRPSRYRRDGTPYPEGTEGLFEWAHDFEDLSLRIVDRTWTIYGETVSTVWLGLDHNFWGGEPLIFETMVWSGSGFFSRKFANAQLRYSTETQAHRGHVKVWLRTLVPPPLRRFFFVEWS